MSAMTGPTADDVWRALTKASFAVISHTTPTGKPRSSGVVYTTIGRQLYVVVAANSWKARHITTGNQVAVTVPIRRGGLMSLLVPIPPATISFHASATVHPAGSLPDHPVWQRLAPLLPPDRRTTSAVLEISPEGQFLTYGIGVSLMRMRDPAVARGRVPVSYPLVASGGRG
jgi:hypothetical protein